MWLLDHNIPHQLISVLKGFSITFDTTQRRGWAKLRNGDLLAAASAAGFICILTRDVLFREHSATTLKKNPQMAIVLVRLPQMTGKLYAEAFKQAWFKTAIVPVSGQLITWPK